MQELMPDVVLLDLVLPLKPGMPSPNDLVGKLHLSDCTQAGIYTWREGLVKE